MYAVCIHDVDKIQEELGNDGVLAEFVDPFKQIKGRNYQLFMNILPEMRSMVNQLDSIMIRERIGQLPGLCDDALRRHVGNLDRVIEQEKKNFESILMFWKWNSLTLIGLLSSIITIALGWDGFIDILHSFISKI